MGFSQRRNKHEVDMEIKLSPYPAKAIEFMEGRVELLLPATSMEIAETLMVKREIVLAYLCVLQKLGKAERGGGGYGEYVWRLL